MLHNHVRLEDRNVCTTVYAEVTKYAQKEATDLHYIEKFVVATIILFAILFLLSGIKKRFVSLWLKFLSSGCYMVIPILVSYTLGLMGKPIEASSSATTKESGNNGTSTFTGAYAIWGVFLLFTNAGFDNLSAFTIEEINGRSKILFQFLSQFGLYLFLLYTLTWKSWIYSISLVFVVVCFKIAERLFALAHASGSTRGIKENLSKIINHNNDEDDKDNQQFEVDPLRMEGFKYLSGPKYTTMKDGRIADGITLERIWRCKGKLLSTEIGGGDQDGQLKDTCLSFALFWLLMGKVRGCSDLYSSNPSKIKAWKLIHDGLLAGDKHDRLFRVIEVELGFLHDYFYTKYMFFYLNGFYWKLLPLVTFPVMLWYFPFKSYDYETLNFFYEFGYGVKLDLNPKAFGTIILILYALEIIQLVLLITSRWCKVILICYYVKKEGGFVGWCLERIIKAICRVSVSCRPWRRKINQYSLLESPRNSIKENKLLQSLGVVLGFALPKPGRTQGKSEVLTEDLKSAVVQSLKMNGPILSNGISSLRKNRVEEKLSWAIELKNESEVILVWHIATSICEMQGNPNSQGFGVATKLSKYCAYLLAFAPLLLSIPLLEAEVTCESAIKEARYLLLKPGCSPCGKMEEVDKYNKLKDLLNGDKEVGNERKMPLENGVKLGEDLLAIREGDRWKILEDFWAEIILYMASSKNNEMVHVEKLLEGGEFITHLWALRIHAGIVDRNT